MKKEGKGPRDQLSLKKIIKEVILESKMVTKTTNN
jgi:hypothetical protein